MFDNSEAYDGIEIFSVHYGVVVIYGEIFSGDEFPQFSFVSTKIHDISFEVWFYHFESVVLEEFFQKVFCIDHF